MASQAQARPSVAALPWAVLAKLERPIWVSRLRLKWRKRLGRWRRRLGLDKSR